MALTFRKIDKTKMPNSEHFQLLTRFKSAVFTRLAYLHLRARTAFNQVFTPAYNTLDAGIKKIRKSAVTEQIMAKDRERDDIFAGMVAALAAALKHFDPERRERARRVKVLFDAYGNIAAKSLDAETGEIYNFLQDLRGPAYNADADALGLLEWAALLENQNMALNNLLIAREGEAAGRPDVDVRQARAAADDAYDQMTAMIEGSLLLGEGDTEMQTELVTHFNQVIDRFIRRMNRRKGRPGGGAEEDVDDGDEDVGETDGGDGQSGE